MGNPLEFILTAGEVADVTQAEALLAGRQAQYGVMDNAYDADKVLKKLELQGIIPVIPPQSNRQHPRDYDRPVYKERHLIECLIGKLQQFRRVFARFDKTAVNFMNFIRFAAALIWLQ